MRFSKRFRWLTIFVILFASAVIFLAQVDSVQATFSNLHAGEVLLRVEAEITRKTPAGRYYNSLFYEHLEELNQIISAHPEHVEVMLHTIRMFIPGLEALLDGKGDAAYITSEHIETLKAELDWFSSVGSSTLREDIQKEQQRLSLDEFVGMTMSDAWEFINSKWTPDMVPQTTSIPESVVQPSPTPVLVVNTVLMPGSIGKYEVPGGAYLEYLSSYDFQVNEEPVALGMKHISFHPKVSVDQQQRRYWIMLETWNTSPAEKEIITNNMYSSGGVVWERMIQTEDFEGIEYIFILNVPNGTVREIGALLYNQESQLIMHIDVRAPYLVPSDANFAELIDRNYPHFQHIVDNLHIQVP